MVLKKARPTSSARRLRTDLLASFGILEAALELLHGDSGLHVVNLYTSTILLKS